ncbi:MAG: enoyl-CoA hydratase/isomerase family protein [SAR324 cluster bacterium]|nr:enoyl-CoA hydratase/isomerase family protein [SAR324 cluster bacterium]
MAFRFLKISAQNEVGWVEFNRPPINAFNGEMVAEFAQALDELLGGVHPRVVVLASALNKYFSVGAELQVFEGLGAEGMKAWIGSMHSIAKKLRAANKPLLAALHGTCVGGGLEMTLHCDLRFAAADARFGQPEINLNFIPPIATTQSLVRLLGRPRAIRYLYEGTLVSSQEALEMGLVDFVIAPERLREEVQAYAEDLARKPPEALAAIRRTMTDGMDLPFEEAMRLEFDAAVELAGTPNFKEGVRAFLEKRKPRWE